MGDRSELGNGDIRSLFEVNRANFGTGVGAIVCFYQSFGVDLLFFINQFFVLAGGHFGEGEDAGTERLFEGFRVGLVAAVISFLLAEKVLARQGFFKIGDWIVFVSRVDSGRSIKLLEPPLV